MTFPEQYRAKHPLLDYDSQPGDTFGYFRIPGYRAHGNDLQIIAVNGLETCWEHVSVSIVGRPKKCPSWQEMSLVKSLFWSAEECVIQFHPPTSEYVNYHEGCLHLWRHTHYTFPLPPSILVGPR